MRKTFTITILLFMILIMAFGIGLVIKIEDESTDLISRVSFVENTCGLEIELYYDSTDDIYYLFLPAYTDISAVEIKAPSNIRVSFGEGEYNFSNLPLEEDINVTFTRGKRQETCVLQVWQCDNLDTICIETSSGTLEDVDEDKSYEEDATVAIINEDGSIEYEGAITINKRGNSTAKGGKKAYNLNFNNEITIWDGEYSNVTKLCLLANYYDESNLKNYIGYYAAKMGGWNTPVTITW